MAFGLKLNQKPIAILDSEDLDKGEFSWIDLGKVGYGIRNDHGSVHVHMKLGVLIGNRPDYPHAIVDVIEKYYGASYGIDFSQPHKTESVVFHKPRHLYKLIKRFSGKDERTHKEEFNDGN